jgi:cell division control protein 11
LCGKKVLKGKDSDDPVNAHLEEGVKIKPVTVGQYSVQCHLRCTNIEIDLELDEEGTRISLTIVDTPGFGDQIDNEARLVKYLEKILK